MSGFQQLEQLGKLHGLVYELGGGQRGMASVTARKGTTRSSRKWLVGEGSDFEEAAQDLIRQIEEATTA